MRSGVVSTEGWVVSGAPGTRGASPPVCPTAAGGCGGLGTIQSSVRLKGVVPSKVIQVTGREEEGEEDYKVTSY